MESGSESSSLTLSDSEAEEEILDIKPIKLNDIFPYYDVEPEEVDKETAELLRKNKMQQISRNIDRINRNLQVILKHWENPSSLELYVGFMKALGDPEELVFRVTQPAFLEEVKEEVKTLRNQATGIKPRPRRRQKQKQVEEEEEEEENDDGDFHLGSSEHHSSTQGKDYKTFTLSKKRKRKDEKTKSAYKKPKEVNQEEWDKWSEAHRKSYIDSAKNPNSYYYRNLAPGEKKRSGVWTAEEKKNFLARLNEMKPTWEGGQPQWGIFSMTIPGRVGYQCSNFYRRLIMDGEIKDDNYFVDKQGKWHYRLDPNRNANQKVETVSSVAISYEQMCKDNPLPNNLIDSITSEPIKAPAISPDGYVLDYSTWMEILKKHDPVDPFTRRPINKRKIVVLNHENIDEYKPLIKNLDL